MPAIFSRLRHGDGSVWAATALLFVVTAVFAPQALSVHSISALLSFAAVLMVVAAGQTLVVQQRGLDLSMPGVITLCSMVLPITITRADVPFPLAVLITLAVGLGIGLLNGLLVTRVGITPLIVTLAMGSILTGLVFFYTGGLPSTEAPAPLVDFIAWRPLGVPIAFIIATAIVIVVAVLMVSSSAGRRFVAAGSNAQAARAASISVDSYVVAAYVLSGMSSAIAALLLTGYVRSASISIGDEYLFTSIAAVVIGGTSFLGGKGSVIASALGAIFLTQLVQVLLASGASASVQLLAQAIAIALAVALRTVVPRLVALRSSRASSAVPATGSADVERRT